MWVKTTCLTDTEPIYREAGMGYRPADPPPPRPDTRSAYDPMQGRVEPTDNSLAPFLFACAVVSMTASLVSFVGWLLR